MLQATDLPLVYKPLQAGDRGRSEVLFYETVCKRAVTAFPRCIMPTYHGLVYDGLPSDETSMRYYIALEDLARPFRYPCVLDVKVGVRTWGDSASPEKIAAELSKFPLQQHVGFRITGMRVWDLTRKGFREHGRAFGYALDEASLHNAFTEFFHNGHVLRRDVIQPLLSKLRELQDWMACQKECVHVTGVFCCCIACTQFFAHLCQILLLWELFAVCLRGRASTRG